MFNRKKYLITIITLGVACAALIITNAIWVYMDWLMIAILALAGSLILRGRISAPLQLFGTKFTMLVDYDLEVAEAVRIAKEGADNAPTAQIKAMYTMYYGMGQYYAGDYDGAIRTFNQVELKRMNSLFHVLIFAFICYSAFELGDETTFASTLQRLRNVAGTVSPKYQGYAQSYLEILEAIDQLSADPEHYREVMEKHFNREDGYISTRLIRAYRLALYYRQIQDYAEMDKQLAFVIANGKEHHTALQAKKLFKNSVNVEDYVIKPESESGTPEEETQQDQIENAEEHSDDTDDNHSDGE
ncbi:MAG: hypothetical protein V1761_04320 [bacterium]